MRADELIMVSVDDHLVEPPGMFEGRLPARMQDLAPHVERLADGSDVWMFNGVTIPNIGLNAVAGRPKDEYGIEPTAFDEMRPGCFDVHERIKDMNAGGVLGLDELPVVPRVQRPAIRRLHRQGAGARRGPRLQRLAHRRVVRFLSGPVHSHGTARSCGTLSCAPRR